MSEEKIYTGKHCGQKFTNRYKLTGHSTHCDKNPNKLTVNNLEHYNKTSQGNKVINLYNECNCKYCGKQYFSLNALIQHEIRCRKNENRINIENSAKNIINYNLSDKHKNTNKYIKAMENNLPKPVCSNETKKKISDKLKGRVLSEETKKKISDTRKKQLEENIYASSWLSNHSSKPSYGELYFMDVFENEKIPLKYHKQVGRYQLDFYNEIYKKYIEIDGEQHYTPKGILHDKERTDILLNKGWIGLRIRWSEFKKLTYKEKVNKINYIKQWLYN